MKSPWEKQLADPEMIVVSRLVALRRDVIMWNP